VYELYLPCYPDQSGGAWRVARNDNLFNLPKTADDLITESLPQEIKKSKIKTEMPHTWGGFENKHNIMIRQ
jgi:hypothetical protein